MLYHQWLLDLKVGDEVVITGSLVIISPLYRGLPFVCHIGTKSLGVLCHVEKVGDKTLRIGGRYFDLQSGTSSSTQGKYRLQIFPPILQPTQAAARAVSTT